VKSPADILKSGCVRVLELALELEEAEAEAGAEAAEEDEGAGGGILKLRNSSTGATSGMDEVCSVSATYE
jgi:hypothetical protein